MDALKSPQANREQGEQGSQLVIKKEGKYHCCGRSRDFVSILANMRFLVQDRPIYGLGAGYMSINVRLQPVCDISGL